MLQMVDKTAAVLATHRFEQAELMKPVSALRKAGAIVEVVSPEAGAIRGWNETDWGQEVAVDDTLDQARPDDYGALVRLGEKIRVAVRGSAGGPVRARDVQPEEANRSDCHGPRS